MMSTLTLDSCGQIPYNNTMFNIYIDQEFVDTDLILSNGRIKTHSVILAAQSKKLYDMLISQEGEQKTITLTQYTKETMRIILEYMYRGIVTYPMENDQDVKAAVHFLGLCFEADPKDKIKVEKLEEDTQNSIIEIKQDETLIEISDSENEMDCSDSINENNSKDVIIEKESKIENSRSRLLDEFHEIVTQCCNDPPNEVIQESIESEKSPLSVNKDIKEKQKKCLVKNPFSEYVTVKKPMETSNLLLKNHNIDQPTSISHFENSDIDISTNEEHKHTKEKSNEFSSIYKTNNFEKVETNLCVNKKLKVNEKSLEISTSTVQMSSTKPQKDKIQNKTKPDTNIWMSKKQNPCSFPKNYCIVCEKVKINIKFHIKTIHKRVVRLPNYFCSNCSKHFFFKEFSNIHE